MERKRVGIALFEDVEVLDFSGPFEILSVTQHRSGVTDLGPPNKPFDNTDN